MSKQKAENYAFPCSLIRANEKTLLTAQDLERVMDARDMQQAMHILAEFGYGDGRELTNPRGFEEVLAGEMNRVSELVSSLSVVPSAEGLSQPEGSAQGGGARYRSAAADERGRKF